MPNTSRKIILVLSHEFPPLGGGGGRVMALLCRELHERGYESEVWTSGVHPSRRRRFPFNVRYFPTPRTAGFDTNYPAIILYLVQIFFRGLLTVRRQRYAIIFSNLVLPAALAGHVLSRLFRIPHVTWHHGAEVHGNDPDKGVPGYYKFFLRKIWPKAAMNFFVSQSLLERALTIGTIERAAVLPIALDITSDPIVHKKSYTQKMYLFAGRLEPVKNLPFLFSVIEKIEQNGLCAEAKFYFAGDGALLDELKRRAALFEKPERVVFLGPVPCEKMENLYADAYALMLPSHIEGFPLTILEAAAHGVPTIGTDTDGIRDAVVHEKTGLLFRPNDLEACVACVNRLYTDQAMRDALGSNAREEARRFTVRRSADLFINAVKTHLQ